MDTSDRVVLAGKEGQSRPGERAHDIAKPDLGKAADLFWQRRGCFTKTDVGECATRLDGYANEHCCRPGRRHDDIRVESRKIKNKGGWSKPTLSLEVRFRSCISILEPEGEVEDEQPVLMLQIHEQL